LQKGGIIKLGMHGKKKKEKKKEELNMTYED
jgi:hypothetical protein